MRDRVPGLPDGPTPLTYVVTLESGAALYGPDNVGACTDRARREAVRRRRRVFVREERTNAVFFAFNEKGELY